MNFALLLMVQGVNPNVQQDFHSLPGMKVWKGQPFTDFRLTWFAALIVALGTIFQQDWTLLQTARDQDEGSPQATLAWGMVHSLQPWQSSLRIAT